MKKNVPFFHICILISFLANMLGPLPLARAQEFHLPVPGVMVHLSPEFNPPVLKGIKVHPDNPFRFDFILDKGDVERQSFASLRNESTQLIKYFLASLTIPEKDLWVNLSPYEKNRIIPQSFGLTEMGRDLLAEDYMLKQITASLIYPEGETGKKFWKRIYEEAAKKFGTTNIPVNTFNKVWIVPEKAVVYENTKAGTAYVIEAKLKVMLEQDYLALSHSVIASEAKQSFKEIASPPSAPRNDTNRTMMEQVRPKPFDTVNALGSQIVREIVIPELTQEINYGRNFAQLRQVYNSLILATWYKKKIKDSILAQVYENRNKIKGIDLSADPLKLNAQAIYQRYLQAFKKGAYNYIKEETDPMTQQIIPRKYFSGGEALMNVRIDYAMSDHQVQSNGDDLKQITVDFASIAGGGLSGSFIQHSVSLEDGFVEIDFMRFVNREIPLHSDRVGINLYNYDVGPDHRNHLPELMAYSEGERDGIISGLRGVFINPSLRHHGLLPVLLNLFFYQMEHAFKGRWTPHLDANVGDLYLHYILMRDFGFGPDLKPGEKKEPNVWFGVSADKTGNTHYQVYLPDSKDEAIRHVNIGGYEILQITPAEFDQIKSNFVGLYIGTSLVVKDQEKFKNARAGVVIRDLRSDAAMNARVANVLSKSELSRSIASIVAGAIAIGAPMVLINMAGIDLKYNLPLSLSISAGIASKIMRPALKYFYDLSISGRYTIVFMEGKDRLGVHYEKRLDELAAHQNVAPVMIVLDAVNVLHEILKPENWDAQFKGIKSIEMESPLFVDNKGGIPRIFQNFLRNIGAQAPEIRKRALSNKVLYWLKKVQNPRIWKAPNKKYTCIIRIDLSTPEKVIIERVRIGYLQNKMDQVNGAMKKARILFAPQDLAMLTDSKQARPANGLGMLKKIDAEMVPVPMKRKYEGQSVRKIGRNLNKGTGGVNDIYVAVTSDGQRIVVKIPKSRNKRYVPGILNDEESKLIELEPYGGPEYWGRVRINIEGEERVGLAMEKINGIDLDSIIKKRKPPFKITQKHIDSLLNLMAALKTDNRQLLHENDGNYFLTADGRFRPNDMYLARGRGPIFRPLTDGLYPNLGVVLYRLRLYQETVNARFDKIGNRTRLASNKTGGIDLTSDKAFSVQSNGQGIKFHINPAQLEQLQNSPGLTPVIINIQPVRDIRAFLGLNTKEAI